MTDKELRRLRRKDLIRMVLEKNQETENLQRQLDEVHQQLKDKEITIESSGSIAEAALRLHNVFNAAQEAADQYVENVRIRTEGQLEQFEKEKEEQFLRLANKEEEVNARLFAQEAEMNSRLMAQETEMNTRLMMLEMESNRRIEAQEAEVNARMAKKEAEVNARLKQQEEEMRAHCDQLLLDAKTRSQKYWSDIQLQMKSYMAEHMKYEPANAKSNSSENHGDTTLSNLG